MPELMRRKSEQASALGQQELDGQGQVGAQPANEQKSPEDLRREIKETRAELGDTAAALAEKADIKSRAREKVDGLKRTAPEKARQNAMVSAAACAFIGGFIFGRITR